MNVNVKKLAATLFLTGSVAAVNASVCNIVSGSVTCGHGTVESLSGNGIAIVNGTTVLGATLINGLLNAEDANFFSLDVNGSGKCQINSVYY